MSRLIHKLVTFLSGGDEIPIVDFTKLQEWQTRVASSESELINDAEFAFWTAGLTFDSVIISVFSIAISFSPNKTLSAIIVILSLLSAVLFVMNFHVRLHSHRRIMSYALQDSSGKMVNTLGDKRQFEMRWIVARENVAKTLFICQFFLIVWFLL